MSPKPKTMSPNFISGRNIKQAGKRDAYAESELTESDDRQRKLGSFASSKKGGSHCIPSAFNINQAYKLGRSQTCHISNICLYENMDLCVDCMVSEYLPLPKFKSLIVLLV